MKMVKAIRKQAGAAERAAFNATDPLVAEEMKTLALAFELKQTLCADRRHQGFSVSVPWGRLAVGLGGTKALHARCVPTRRFSAEILPRFSFSS
jgi:hypothetical protein